MDKDRWGLNKSQRMQLKAFVCLLGILLLAVLAAAKVILLILHKGEVEEPPVPTPEPHIPVVQLFANVWIMEVDEEGLLLFRDGEQERYPWGAVTGEDGQEQPYRADNTVREQVADVELTDGEVTAVAAKTDKINGKILRAEEGAVELEGYGWLPLAADYKGYRLFDRLEMCTVNDLYFGYDFTDFCIDEGEICGVLMAKEEAMEYIRVLVKAPDYSGLLHDSPVITCDVDYTVIYGRHDGQKQEKHAAGEELTFGYDSPYFEAERVSIVPEALTGRVKISNGSRAQGIPSYRGQMELLRTEEGIAVINEVLLEEYLYSVVPSEMPDSYPAEALKAQAICARTYAYGRMEHAGYPQYGAHVDDSTSYQVYNNIQERETTTTAVKETYGQLLYTEAGSLAGTFYYSTSCGMGTDANIWKTEEAPTLTYLGAKPLSRTAFAGGPGENAPEGTEGQGDSAGAAEEEPGERLRQEEAFGAFISAVNPDDFEAGEGWYRWSYRSESLNKEHMLENLQRRYAANSRLVLTWRDGDYVSETITELNDISDIYIEKRGVGGVADELVIEAGDQKIKVISEHNIRYVLNDGTSKILRQDGSQVASPNLLPSGFFVISVQGEEGKVEGYTLTGGGFGHGVGMSQNGAKQMAAEGYGAGEILLYFYENCVIKNIYE